MITVTPDPAHPRGGYARLSLPADSLNGDTTQVSVFDNYSERYLGEAGWQPVRVLFGPYAIERQGDQAHLVIGPEIVNQIEEYANVKLDVGGVQADVAWPDDVVPAPGAAKIGGILAANAPEAAAGSRLKAQIQTDAPDPADPEPVDPVPAPDPVPEPTPAPKSRMGAPVGLAVIVLAAAGLAYWLLFVHDTSANFVPMADPEPEPVANACSIDALGALDGFAAQMAGLRECGSDASADAALRLVEEAAGAGDAAALLLFGTAYDGAVSAPVIEEEIGLTFGDVPSTAAEYYARAVDAGSDEAIARLQALCERMGEMTDTLALSAVEDHCNR